jgi:hypothetical protein
VAGLWEILRHLLSLVVLLFVSFAVCCTGIFWISLNFDFVRFFRGIGNSIGENVVCFFEDASLKFRI